MRAPASAENGPLLEHTLMPTHMRERFSPAELVDMELAEPFGFTKGVRTLRIPGRTFINAYHHGTLLFDLESDPEQLEPLVDDAVELRMAGLLVELMRRNEAPESQYERLGLPAEGPVGEHHLLVRAQRAQAQSAARPLPRTEDYPEGRFSLRSPVLHLLGDPAAAEVVKRHLPAITDSELLQFLGSTSLIDVAAMAAQRCRPTGSDWSPRNSPSSDVHRPRPVTGWPPRHRTTLRPHPHHSCRETTQRTR